MPWDADLRKLRTQFSIRRDHRASNVVEELETRGYYHNQGERETAPIPFFQSIDDFIDGLHSRSGFSRERMGQQKAIEFDQQVRALLSQFHPDGVLAFQVVGTVTWGIPETGSANGVELDIERCDHMGRVLSAWVPVLSLDEGL